MARWLKTDGSLDLVPGRLKPAHCSWLPWRKDSPGWENAEEKFTATSACVCVCVCPVSLPKMHVCVAVCCLCHNKLTLITKQTLVFLSLQLNFYFKQVDA